jgi:hypothetical protein
MALARYVPQHAYPDELVVRKGCRAEARSMILQKLPAAGESNDAEYGSPELAHLEDRTMAGGLFQVIVPVVDGVQRSADT